MTFSYDAHRSGQLSVKDYSVEGLINYADRAEERYNNGRSFNQTVQADYVHPIKKSAQIDGGLKYIFRKGTDDIQAHLLSENNPPVIIADMTNYSQRDEHVATAYLSFRWHATQWLFDAGGRTEYSHAAFSDKSTDRFSKNYFKIVPNASLVYQLKNGGKFTFGYTMNSYKPALNQMNPTVLKTGEKSISYGNPNIKPMKSHAFQLIYDRMFGMATFITSNTLSYTNTVDGIVYYNMLSEDSIYHQSYSNAENSRKITFTTFENLNLFNRKLRISALFSPSYVMMKNSLTGEKTSGFEYFYNTSLTYTLNPKTSFATSLNGITNLVQFQANIKMNSLHDRYTANYTPSSKWSFSLSANNVFNPINRTKTEMNADNFQFESKSANHQLLVEITVRYKFGGDIKVKESKRKIRNNDMK